MTRESVNPPREGTAQGALVSGPWTEVDVAWFSANPREHWYAREPIGNELHAFLATGGATQAQIVMDALVLGVVLRVLVIQVVPGHRVRFPFAGSTPVATLHDADHVAPVTMAPPVALAWLRRLFPTAPPLPDEDVCTVCKRRFVTGDLNLGVVRAGKLIPSFIHTRCKIPRGARVVSTALYIAHGDGDPSMWSPSMRAHVEAQQKKLERLLGNMNATAVRR